MEIFIGADHNGYKLKGELASWLEEQGHAVTDVGAHELDSTDDYPDYGIKVARAVAENPDDRVGLLLCGSGVGMAVTADKVQGIRAALIHDPEIAAAARRDDAINILALGASYISVTEAKQVIEQWLATPFSGEERHKRRIKKIEDYEKQY